MVEDMLLSFKKFVSGPLFLKFGSSVVKLLCNKKNVRYRMEGSNHSF